MIILSFVIIIIALFILTSYICYRIAFLAPKRVDESTINAPSQKEYDLLRDGIQKSIDRMRNRPFEPVTITSFDGTKLYARYYHVADGAPVQILFHGYKSHALLDCSGGSYFAEKLGQNALVVDQRSHGKSEGTAITFGVLERKDCLCWINYILTRCGQDTKIILSGLSMGAATVLMATDLNLPQNVIGVMADCPYSSPEAIIRKVAKTELHLPDHLMYPFIKFGAKLFARFDLEESSAIEAVKYTKLPILLIHGEADNFVPCDMSREMAKANPSMVTLVTIPDARHGLCYMVNPARYEEAVESFMQKVLGDVPSK